MKDFKNKKLKILVCAFACVKDPDRRFGFGEGGEVSLGWNVVLQLSRFFQVSVLTDAGNKEAIEKILLYKDLPSMNFYYIDVPWPLRFTKKRIQIYTYLWQIKAYFFAKKLHKEFNFDVFHHVTYANDWMASHIGALLPISYIRGPGGGAHRVPNNFVKNYSVKERLGEWIRSAGQWVFRHDPFFIIGQNRASAILVCNHEAFNALPEKWQKKAHFFPVNGISKEDLLFKAKEKKPNNKFLILSAGKFIKIKGFDLAIKAFKIFIDKIADAKFVIIGDGPELKNLKNLVSKLKLQEKVIFEKWMPRKELLQKIISSDVFIFTSLRDGGGNVVVEAMAQGKPVVCFDIAGPGFHVDETCGIRIKPLYPEQAVKDLSKALERLYSDKKLRIMLGNNARKKAIKQYSWDVLGDRLYAIYKKSL